jgi:hypothetical protein
MNFEMVSNFEGHFLIMIMLPTIDGQENGKAFCWKPNGLVENMDWAWVRKCIYFSHYYDHICSLWSRLYYVATIFHFFHP